MQKKLLLHGVMTASVTPFRADGSLDEDGLRRYVRRKLSLPGVTGLLCNGYSGEIDGLSSEERTRTVRICAEETRGRAVLVAGVTGSSLAGAVELGSAAREAGADAIQVNSPFYNLLRRGFLKTPDATVEFFQTLNDELDMPMSVFQYPTWTGLTYPPETISLLAEIENVVAVKEAVDLDTYVADYQVANGKLALLADHNGYTLLPMLLLGAEGTMVGISNVGTELFVALFDHVQARRYQESVELMKGRILPLMEALSRDLGRTRSSFVGRVKEALVLLGELETSVVRPPETPATPAEREEIRRALISAGLLGRDGQRLTDADESEEPRRVGAGTV